jgi:hypothetical protein
MRGRWVYQFPYPPENWCSADDSNVASLPYQGIASPSMLAELEWFPEAESNRRTAPSEGTSRVPPAGKNWHPGQESNLQT